VPAESAGNLVTPIRAAGWTADGRCEPLVTWLSPGAMEPITGIRRAPVVRAEKVWRTFAGRSVECGGVQVWKAWSDAETGERGALPSTQPGRRRRWPTPKGVERVCMPGRSTT
jgi:hypothetical protein